MNIGDKLYSLIVSKRRIFADGWGDMELLDSIKMPSYLGSGSIKQPHIDWKFRKVRKNLQVREGRFLSPTQTPDFLPDECKLSAIQLISPDVRTWRNLPLYIHFSASGDRNFYLRYKCLAVPLAQKGIAS